MKIAILNGRVIDPASNFDQAAGVFIDEGCIAAIGRAPEQFRADTTLDAA
ncbi:MAG: dihydroorotase, partial [Burkholderiaceae bacterium]|nr:dihydroorotase [Burkholderiaceae bacterium]